MMFFYLIASTLLILNTTFTKTDDALFDLESCIQPFVLDTKQIIIPEFPGAFNASILPIDDKLLLCFRIRDKHMVSTFEIGFVWLGSNFNIISKPAKLTILNSPSTFEQNQDPRLIMIEKKPYILYSNFIQLGEVVTRRMFVAPLHYKNNAFFIERPLCLHHPLEKLSPRWEKNWVPFNYHESLLLAYSIVPHTIVQPSLTSGESLLLDSTYSAHTWPWGELRGGTNAILLDQDHYLAFFHSSTYCATLHSQGKNIQHYFMGAYLFSATPPFALTHISPVPIIGKNFYHGKEYKTWKSLRVVFPMSCFADEHYIWLCYGRQDHEIWVAQIDKEELLKSLIPTPHLMTFYQPEENESPSFYIS